MKTWYNIILLIENSSYRSAVEKYYQESNTIKIVNSSSKVKQTKEFLSNNQFDYLIVDLSIYASGKKKFGNCLQDMIPLNKIILTSVYDYEEYVTNTITDGLAGFLPKFTLTDRLENLLDELSSSEAKKYHEPHS